LLFCIFILFIWIIKLMEHGRQLFNRVLSFFFPIWRIYVPDLKEFSPPLPIRQSSHPYFTELSTLFDRFISPICQTYLHVLTDLSPTFYRVISPNRQIYLFHIVLSLIFKIYLPYFTDYLPYFAEFSPLFNRVFSPI